MVSRDIIDIREFREINEIRDISEISEDAVGYCLRPLLSLLFPFRLLYFFDSGGAVVTHYCLSARGSFAALRMNSIMV